MTSPDGRFKIEVTNTGIKLDGPGGGPSSILFTGAALDIHLANDMLVMAGNGIHLKAAAATIEAGANFVVESSGTGVIKSSVLNLGCSSGGLRVARQGDPVAGTSIVTGSTKVLAC